jgi:hypothetical protein
MTAKTLLSNSFRIAWKDLMELFRNRLGLVMLVLMPIFMMGMVGFIFPSNNSLNNVSVGLANQDAGFGGSKIASQTFLTILNGINNQTGMLDISNATDLVGLKESVQRGEIQGGIVIPSNFTQCILNGQQGTLIIVTDNSNPQVSAAMQTALAAVFQQMGTMLAQQNVMALNPAFNASSALAIVQPYDIQVEGVVSGHSSYFDFIAPGIMAMTVMMSVMTGLPAAISQEKEVGTLDGMMVALNHSRQNSRSNRKRPFTRRNHIGAGLTPVRNLHSRKHPASLCLTIARRLQLRRLRSRAHVFRQRSRNSHDGYDDAHVSDDVPERCVLPSAADAMVHADHIQSLTAYLCC